MSSAVRKESPDDEPVWRERIAEAVSLRGQLKAIASAARMKSPQLQKIANGITVNPGVVTLARIAGAMGMTLIDLVGQKEDIATIPIQALKSAPGAIATHVRQVSPKESGAQKLPSSSAEHGKSDAVPSESEVASALRDLRAATAALTRAIDYANTISGDTMADDSRQITDARTARPRKRAKPRANRRKGSGAS